MNEWFPYAQTVDKAIKHNVSKTKFQFFFSIISKLDETCSRFELLQRIFSILYFAFYDLSTFHFIR
jgi:hypothetical protein